MHDVENGIDPDIDQHHGLFFKRIQNLQRRYG
jgi:hypothetical protein